MLEKSVRVPKKNGNISSILFTKQTVCKESSVPDSPGLVDFAIGLVNSVFNLPNRQVMFFEEFT